MTELKIVSSNPILSEVDTSKVGEELYLTAFKLGFSAQEIIDLKRLYIDKPKGDMTQAPCCTGD